jgi:hypothetical protein
MTTLQQMPRNQAHRGEVNSEHSDPQKAARHVTSWVNSGVTDVSDLSLSSPSPVTQNGASEGDVELMKRPQSVRRVRSGVASANDDDDDDNDAAAAAVTSRVLNHASAASRSPGPPLQTPQFWIGAAIGGLLSLLVLPLALWAWSASDPSVAHLPHTAPKSNRITRRRALYFGLVFGAGVSVTVLGLALSIYIIAATSASLLFLIVTGLGVIIGPIVAYRGLSGWLELQRRYRMRQADLYVLLALMALVILAVIATMVRLFLGALTMTM